MSEAEAKLDNIRNLLTQELWGSAEILCSSLLSTSSSGGGDAVKAKTTEYLADSYFHRKDYKRALFHYSQALVLKSSSKDRTEADGILFKKSKCYIEMNESSNAVQELEMIPHKNRTVQINMMIARLYHTTRLKRLAIVAYKTVLGAEPLALEAYEVLLSLGVEAADLVTYVKSACQMHSGHEWMMSFLRMLATKQGSDYDGCSTECNILRQTFSKNSVCILKVLAEAAAISDRNDEAAELFELILLADEYAIDNFEDYGLILHDKRDEAKLNELANKFLAANERKEAGWLFAAMFCDLKEDTDKAKLLVDRVLQLNPTNICAHLFKGKMLLRNGHSDQALVSLYQANIQRKDVRSFSLLIDALLAANKVKEANDSARECLSVAPRAAKSHILMGHILMGRRQETGSMGESIKSYQKALEIDPKSILAASSLAEAYSTQDKYLEAVSVLKRTLELNGKCSESHRLRTQLARCYTRMEDYASAIEELHLVIELDPDHSDAIAELERCEQLLSPLPGRS